MSSRYSKFPFIQPSRTIRPAITDIIHPLTQFENIDSLADRYYGDVNLNWIIMCANPDFFLEFAIPPGAMLRIPFPLERVYAEIGQEM
jgi:hypothetical protein